MKLVLLTLAVSLATTAHARHPNQGQAQGQAQLQGQNQEQMQNANGSGGNVDIQNRRQIPAAGVGINAGSSNSTARHRHYRQRSKAFAWGAFAHTNVDMVFSVTSFVNELETTNMSAASKSRLELAACIEEQSFRELRSLEGNECPAVSVPSGSPLNGEQTMPITLDDMSNLAHEMILADESVKKAESLLKLAKAQHARIKEETIPSAMQELGIKSYTLETGETLKLEQAVYAAIPKAKKVECFNWLDENGFGGLIKTEVKIQFGKDERDQAIERYESLQKEGMQPAIDMSVHASTLKSFIKEQLAKGEDFPLDLFGARACFEAKISKK